jgi:hypothetical protein
MHTRDITFHAPWLIDLTYRCRPFAEVNMRVTELFAVQRFTSGTLADKGLMLIATLALAGSTRLLRH